VFAGVEDAMTIAREEIFGPVVCVLPFDEADEAIARAKDTAYASARRSGRAISLARTTALLLQRTRALSG
jgi:acyl-CoA reductase-like NAD-dependent aldehyde dehydrogenase